MVMLRASAEIRSDFHNEKVEYAARTVNGTAMPAKTWWKRYYHAEINGVPCMLRFREGVEVNGSFVKGDWVDLGFHSVEVEKDVSQVYVQEIAQRKAGTK